MATVTLSGLEIRVAPSTGQWRRGGSTCIGRRSILGYRSSAFSPGVSGRCPQKIAPALFLEQAAARRFAGDQTAMK